MSLNRSTVKGVPSTFLQISRRAEHPIQLCLNRFITYLKDLLTIPTTHPQSERKLNSVKLKRRKKNWLRRIKMRNMQKKQLPPLPPGTPGDLRIFYKNTYNINLFDCKIRRRFDVSSIPQYNYCYDWALQLYKNYKTKPAVVIEDVTNRATTNTRFVIFKQDQAIINDPNVFLRRTPPPDDKSISTISDNSYVSAAETVATIDYPPTPAREHQLKELFLTTLDLYYVTFCTWQYLRTASGNDERKYGWHDWLNSFFCFLFAFHVRCCFFTNPWFVFGYSLSVGIRNGMAHIEYKWGSVLLMNEWLQIVSFFSDI